MAGIAIRSGIGRIQRRSGWIMKQQRLNAELDGRAEGRHVDGRVTREPGRHHAARRSRCAARQAIRR